MASRGDGRTENQALPELDALFRLPLAEFTAARNALATRLRKAGRPADAERVKTTPKPSAAAWIVNQLSWGEPEAFSALLAAGDRFRDAQAKQLAGEPADLRGALEARRAALAALTKRAASTVGASPHAMTPDLLRRITTTLEALAAYGTSAGPGSVPTAGRLVDDLSPPGFETLAALVPRQVGESAIGPSRLLQFNESRRKGRAERAVAATDAEARARHDAAADALQQAEQALGDARGLAREAEQALRAAADEAQRADEAKRDAAVRLEEATAAATSARLRARTKAAEAEQAAQRLEDAERAVDRAKTLLEGLPT